MNTKKVLSTNITKEKHFWIIVINSLSYFMLAYFAVIILTNTFSILLAKIEGVKGILYYYGFDLLNIDRSWSHELTFLIFFLGIGFSAALGLFLERAYKKKRRHSKHYKLFLLWGYFLGFTYFFGNMLVGSFFYFGSGVIFEAFNLPGIFRILSGLIAFTALIYLGIYATRGFLISLNSYQTFVDRQDFNWFLKAQMLYPFIIGNVFIVLLKIPHHNDFFMLDTLVWFSGIIPVIAILIAAKKKSSVRFKKKLPAIHLFYYPIVLFIIIMLSYRIGMMNGLRF